MSSSPETAEAVLSTENATEHDDSFRRILKASAMIGMSSVANIGMGIVRTKLVALLLGPAGFGVLGLYNSIADVAVSIAGMGVNSSGVRQIAEAASSGDSARLARTIIVLRGVTAVLGLVGAGVFACFSTQLSLVTFGDDSRAAAIAVVAIAVFLRLISSGQGALLQGLTRIADLAKVNVGSAILATAVSLPMIYFLREDGVALSIVAVAAMSTAANWWYSRKIEIEKPSLSISEVAADTADLIKLGLAFMLSGLLMAGSAYAVRLIIAREISLEAAGLYSSAWTLGGLYVGYVLHAMGADFYPRLVGVANDRERCNQLVNDQTLIGLLLAGPGILATITFAPVVIALFYSAQFVGAVEVLRWICVGMAMRVIIWPLGFVIIAKNRQRTFVAVDAVWSLANVCLTAALAHLYGLTGAGIGFFVPYLIHAALVYANVRSLTGFEWSPTNQRVGALFISTIATVMLASYVLPSGWAIALSGVITALSAIFSVRSLMSVLATNPAPAKLRRLFDLFRRLIEKALAFFRLSIA